MEEGTQGLVGNRIISSTTILYFFLKEEEGNRGLVGNRISVTQVDHQLDYDLDFLQRGGGTKAGGRDNGHLNHRIGTLSIA